MSEKKYPKMLIEKIRRFFIKVIELDKILAELSNFSLWTIGHITWNIG